MTERDPFGQLLTTWLDDGPRAAPSGLLDEVLLAVAARTRRRSLFDPSRGFPVLSTRTRVAAAAVGVVIIGIVGFSTLGPRNEPVVGPGVTPPPSASPSATASPAPSCPVANPIDIAAPAPTRAPSAASRIPGAIVLQSRDRLQAGTTYTTAHFTPPYTIRSVGCWTFGGDDASGSFFVQDSHAGGFFILRPDGVWDVGGVRFLPLPPDMVAWLESRSDLTLGERTRVVIGGFDGTLLDGTVTPGAQTIAGYVLLAGRGGDLTGLSPRDHFELVAVDVRGQNLLIVLSAPAQIWTAMEPELRALLASLAFPAAGP